MKNLTLPILLFSSLFLLSFKPGGEDKKPSDSYIVSRKGDTTYMYGDVTMGGAYINFKNKKDKSDGFMMQKIEYMVVGNRVFKRLATYRPGGYMIEEIIAYSDKYVLTELNEDGAYFMYIWTNNFENVEKKINYGYPAHEKKVVEKYVLPYFGSCKELMDKMNANLESKANFTYGISNYHCGEK